MEAYKDYLSNKGLKSTRQRTLIVEEFFREGAHINADDLFRKVQKRDSSIGLASVYRTLKSLVDSGLAVERRFLNKSSVFEYNDPTAHHDHFICMKCHHIIEFENEEIERLQEQVAKQLGFRLIDHKLELYGICTKGDCARRFAQD
jgi:Fur family ferric uptake transcriptional regulator